MADFIGCPSQRRIMFFENARTKFSKIIWLDCEPYGKNQCKKKEQ